MSGDQIQFTPSPEFEARLFSAAEDLLSVRRERLTARFGRKAQRREWFADLVFRPAFQFAALAALVAVAFNLTAMPSGGRRLTYADLPELPKTNDAGAKYDAELVQERIAYQKEVEDAHRETQGGS